MKQKTIIFFLSLILISFCYADSDYTRAGLIASDFQAGLGYYIDFVNEAETTYYTLTSAEQQPYISDIDADGIKEIIVYDNHNIKVFEKSTLISTDDIYTITQGNDISNIIIENMDDDIYQEIIFITHTKDSGQNTNMTILEYNTTHIYQEYSLNLSYYVEYQGMERIGIQCRDKKCVFAGEGTNGNYLYMFGFNSTHGAGMVQKLNGTASSDYYCLPKIISFPYKDYDNDGKNEFFISAYHVRNVGAERPTIYALEIDSDLDIAEYSTIYSDTTAWIGSQDCSDFLHDPLITSPIVWNFDDGSSNGLELGLGFKYSSTSTSKIYVWHSNGNFYEDYPEVATFDMRFLGNLQLMTGVINGDSRNLCLSGYYPEDSEIALSCIRYGSGIGTYNYVYYIYDNTLHNITATEYLNSGMTHAVQYSDESTGGENKHELLTSVGVLKLIPPYSDDSTTLCDSNKICEMKLIYEIPSEQNAIISADYEAVNREDLIFITDSNLGYINDGWSNRDCSQQTCITYYYFNPSTSGTWKINTSFEIRFKIEDYDNDYVNAKLDLYYNDDNNQTTEWSLNYSSGTIFSFTDSDLKINKTISNGIIRLSARETGNPSGIETLDIPFSVGLNGLEFGDNYDEWEYDGVEEGDEDDSLNLPTGGAVTDVYIDAIDDYLHIGRTLIWILFVIALSFWALAYFKLWEESLSLFTFGFVFLFFIGLLAGRLLGYVSTGIILSIIIVSAGAFVLFIIKLVSGRGSQ